MTTLLQSPKTSNTTRTGSVRILRAEMVRILGQYAATADVQALAGSGSLLVSITSETRRGPITATYRIEAIAGGYTVTKGQVDGAGKWLADTRMSYSVDTSFGGGVVLCDCEDARKRMHDAKLGACCKHRKALRSIGLCE